MKLLIAMLIATNAHAAEHTQSGRAKAFKGPEGEQVTMIPLDESSKMLVYTHDTYGPNTDKIIVYDLRDDAQITFPNPHQSSSQIVVASAHNQGGWTYFDRLDSKLMGRGKEIELTYDEAGSSKIKPQELIKKAKDYEIPRD